MQRRVVTGSGVPTSASCNHSLMTDRVVYRSLMSDNSRWDALKLREGDIVISAPSKCGMTLTQRLVALLVFDGPDLPGPMSTMSPWLDQTIRAIGEVVATLGAQKHRRFIKTHTPLDGLVLDDRVTYIGVGRDPRDAAMSMIFQSANMDPARMRALDDAADTDHPHSLERPPPPAQDGPTWEVDHPDSSAGPPPHEPSAPPGADLSPLDEFHHWMEAPDHASRRHGFARDHLDPLRLALGTVATCQTWRSSTMPTTSSRTSGANSSVSVGSSDTNSVTIAPRNSPSTPASVQCVLGLRNSRRMPLTASGAAMRTSSRHRRQGRAAGHLHGA